MEEIISLFPLQSQQKQTMKNERKSSQRRTDKDRVRFYSFNPFPSDIQRGDNENGSVDKEKNQERCNKTSKGDNLTKNEKFSSRSVNKKLKNQYTIIKLDDFSHFCGSKK